MRRLAALALPLILAACQQEGSAPADATTPAAAASEPGEVFAEDAWCRPTPNGRDMTACYVSLTSSVDDRVVSILSPRAAQAQLHSMTIEGDVMTMREMPDGLPLAAGQTVTLAPGGDHIMLLGVTVPLAEGDRVPLAITFQSGAQIAVEADVGTGPVADATDGMTH